MILPYQFIFLWAVLLSLIISAIYRIFTKPSEIRQLKADMKLWREKSKEAQKNKDLKKANEYMGEMMKLSQKQMRHTMKPMIITLGLVVILLGFVNSSYSGVTVETAPAGDAAIGSFAFDGLNYSLRAEKAGGEIKVTIDANRNGDLSDEVVHSNGDLVELGGADWAVSPESLNKTVMATAVRLPFTFPILGWTYLNWILWYVLVSLPTTWIFRKALGVE